MKTKICTNCNIEKELSEFSKHKKCKYGVRSECKICFNARSKTYRRTKKGLIFTIYYNQCLNSIERGHPLPTYSKQELKDWLFSQKKFHILYDNWKRLDFQKMYSPSVDRKDDYIGYTINNIQITTWEANDQKGKSDRINGINNKNSKDVIQYTKKGEFMKEYCSIRQASRETHIPPPNISQCCAGRNNTAGGFVWKFKGE